MIYSSKIDAITKRENFIHRKYVTEPSKTIISNPFFGLIGYFDYDLLCTAKKDRFLDNREISTSYELGAIM